MFPSSSAAKAYSTDNSRHHHKPPSPYPSDSNNSSSPHANSDLVPLLNNSSEMDDPFYTVQDNVRNQIDRLKIKNDLFFEMLGSCDTYTNVEFKELRKSLLRDVKATAQDVKGLQGALDMVERKRGNFPHITDGEFSNRKQFLFQVNRQIVDLRNNMESQQVRKKLESDEKLYSSAHNNDGSSSSSKVVSRNGYTNVAQSPSSAKAGSFVGSSIQEENSLFINNQKQVTTSILHEQNIQLTALGDAADRLGDIGQQIGQELREQNMMLDQLEDQIDDTEEKMSFVTGALGKLLKTKDRCQLWTIFVLIFILAILIALVIWT